MASTSFDEALDLYLNKDYSLAFLKLKELSDSGVKKAYSLLGLCYLNGNGTTKNFDEAFRLLSEASLNQDENAYYLLGYCYEMGYGTSQNDLQAILWYKNSAKLGKTKSMVALGRIELKYDRSEAIKWLTKAVDDNSIEAMLLLSDVYNDSITLKIKYLTMAALLKSSEALYRLALIYLERDDDDSKIKAQEYLTEAVNLNYDNAYVILGKELISGKRLKPNPKQGFLYLLEAYRKNVEGSDILLADAYYYGKGTKKNPLKAKEILEISARYNNSEAMLNLANYYADETQTEFHDLYISLYWWEQAGILGNVKAMLKAAWCYENSIGTNTVNLDKAYYWLNLASAKGSVEASNHLKDYHKNILGRYHLEENNVNL